MKRYANPVLLVLILLGGGLLLVLTGLLLFPALRLSLRPHAASVVSVAQIASVTPSPVAAAPSAPGLGTPGFTLPTVPVPLTATPTRLSTITIVEQATLKGVYLKITGPGLAADYQVGPLARGAYAVGPNDRFLIYVANNGFVYGLKLGNPHFIRLKNLKHTLIASDRDVEPSISISFVQAEFQTVVLIREDEFGQTVPIPLPTTLTN